jgi:hypothetical protein
LPHSKTPLKATYLQQLDNLKVSAVLALENVKKQIGRASIYVGKIKIQITS